MFRHSRSVAVVALVSFVACSSTLGQLGGSRAGVEENVAEIPGLPRLDRESAEAYITIDGRAEVRVRPSEIRVVLAVTSEAESANECQERIEASITKLKAAWTEMNIPAKNIVEDFIAVLPRYHWKVENQDGVDVGVENRIGFRMQTNIHLALPNDSTAPSALKVAFEQGITDIIAFDYWSQDLDDIKAKAREQAVQAARSKSDILLKALFDKQPRVINVQEQTTIRYPASLYSSFTNSNDQSVTPSWRRDVPFIHASRPQNTYYRGLYTDGDIQAPNLPMHPEISVVSSVRLYFESPAAAKKKD